MSQKSIKRYIVAIIFLCMITFLSSCGVVDRVKNLCSGWNDRKDSFQINFQESRINIPLGEMRTIVLVTSWLDDDLRRESLNCLPNRWEFEPDGVVQLEGFSLTALQVGEATVRAVVEGAGGVKTAEFIANVYVP